MEPTSSPTGGARPRRQFSARPPRRDNTASAHRGPRPSVDGAGASPRPRRTFADGDRTPRPARGAFPRRRDGVAGEHTHAGTRPTAGGSHSSIRLTHSDEPRRRARSQARPRRTMTSPALVQRALPEFRKSMISPVTDPDIVRIVAVSGAEEVGRNMYFYEDKDDIVIFDCGLQFVSPEQKAPGVNYILPNTQYLEEHKDKIRALVITHGHLDHIGGIQFVIERLGYPPIYTQYLTSLLIMKRHEEFPHLEPLNIQVVKEGESFTVGNNLKVKTFPVTHSIPDAMGVMVKSKYGNVVFTGDVRLDHDGAEVVGPEKAVWEKVGTEENLILIADSTNCDRPGFSQPESIVFDNLRKYIRETKGRLIIGTFASQFERLMSIIRACEEYGRVIVPEGRSIKTNVDIAIKAGLLEVSPGIIVSAPEAERYPREKIVILATGAQGEEFAAMSRIATGEHKFFRMDQYDTVILSSSVIPGNELSVQSLKDKIFRNNTRVITYQGDNVHSSGHGYSGEMNWIRRAVKPKFLMPIHGNHFHLKSHMFAAVQDGYVRENVVVPDNGSVIEIYKGEVMRVLPDKMPNEQLTVDGLSVGIRQEVVLRDRLALSNDGMFVIVASLDTRSGKLRKSPDIISRGFVYLRENQQLLNDARMMVKRQIEQSVSNSRNVDLDVLKDEVTDAVTKFLLQRTNKTPIVIPVIIGF